MSFHISYLLIGVGITKDGTIEFFINGDFTTKTNYKKFIHEEMNIPVAAADNLFI